MRARRFEREARELAGDRATLFRHWYTPLVWTLAPQMPRRKLGAWLAQALHPLVDASDVTKTLDALVEGGFLRVVGTAPGAEEDADPGARVEDAHDVAYVHDESLLSISTPASAVVLGRFYADCLSASRKLVGRFEEGKRHVRVTTVTLPARRLEDLKGRLRAFHGDLAAWASEPEVPGEAMAACQITSAAFFLEPPKEG